MRLPFQKKTRQQLPFNNFAEYYIGADVTATGTCQTDQDIFVDGTYHGQLNTSGLVELAKNSHVKADISARTAIIEGSFEGNAKADDELKITSCATVHGKLATANLMVDKGAIVQAHISMERS